VRKRVFYVSNNLTWGAVQTAPGYYQYTYCTSPYLVTATSLSGPNLPTPNSMSHSHNMPSNYHIATPGYEISHSHNMPFNYHIADPSNHHIGTPVYEISPSHNLPSHYHSATPESEVWSKQNDSPEGIALWVSHKKGRALLEGLAYNQSLIPFHIVRNLGERLETTRDAANSGRGTDSVLTYYRNVRTMANQTFDHTKQRVTMCKRAQAFYDLVQNPESNLTVVIHPSTPKPPTSGPWSSHGPNSQAGIPASSNSEAPQTPLDVLFREALALPVGQRPQHGGIEGGYYSDTECLAQTARFHSHTSSAVESP
jgi:hypothetical protein